MSRKRCDIRVPIGDAGQARNRSIDNTVVVGEAQQLIAETICLVGRHREPPGSTSAGLLSDVATVDAERAVSGGGSSRERGPAGRCRYRPNHSVGVAGT